MTHANGRHWPTTDEGVRIGVLVYKSPENQDGVIQPDQMQRLIDACRIWSAGLERVEIGIAGHATAEDCIVSDPVWGRSGYIVVAMDITPGAAALGQVECEWKWWRDEITSTEMMAGAVCSREHIEGGHVKLGSSSGLRTYVHELGHVLGLAHGGGGVMESPGTLIYPSDEDYNVLNEVYAHSDGYSNAAPLDEPEDEPTPPDETTPKKPHPHGGPPGLSRRGR